MEQADKEQVLLDARCLPEENFKFLQFDISTESSDTDRCRTFVQRKDFLKAPIFPFLLRIISNFQDKKFYQNLNSSRNTGASARIMYNFTINNIEHAAIKRCIIEREGYYRGCN